MALPPPPPPPPPRPPKAPAESSWLGGNPVTMLRCLVRLATHRGIVFYLSDRAFARKFRLFYCACCRLRWESLAPTSREVVETVERYVDGAASSRALRTARLTSRDEAAAARNAARFDASGTGGWPAASNAALAELTAAAAWRLRGRFVPTGFPVDTVTQAAILRDLFDNPFHPVELNPAWRTNTVVALARVIYTQRAFELMPLLGDAFQDAGCDDAHILDHCYGSVAHARGCWLLDALLGKK